MYTYIFRDLFLNIYKKSELALCISHTCLYKTHHSCVFIFSTEALFPIILKLRGRKHFKGDNDTNKDIQLSNFGYPMLSMKLELPSLGQHLLIIIGWKYFQVMKILLPALKNCEATLVILCLSLLIGNYH